MQTIGSTRTSTLLKLFGCERTLLGHLSPLETIPVQSSGYGPGRGLQFHLSLDVPACAEFLFPPILED